MPRIKQNTPNKPDYCNGLFEQYGRATSTSRKAKQRTTKGMEKPTGFNERTVATDKEPRSISTKTREVSKCKAHLNKN